MNFRSVMPVLGALVLVAAVVTPELAAQKGVALRGTVRSAQEGTMEGVVVTVRRQGANHTVSVATDARGRYTFPATHLSAGTYALAIRASGYDLNDAPGAAVEAGKTATADLTLAPARDLASQLSSYEWIISMNGTPEQKDKFVHQLMSCNYCHTLERVFKSKLTAEQLVPATKRMTAYYADGTALSNNNKRGRIARVQEHGREAWGNVPVWGFTPGAPPYPRTEVSEFVAMNNLSAGRTTWPFQLKTADRPKGPSTRVIVTEYDMPTATTVPHDMDVDSKGVVWYTDESRQTLGKLDPKTATFKEYPLPPVAKGEIEGARDVVVDRQDKVWFPVRVPGGHSPLARFDPVTETMTIVGGAGDGQFIGLDNTGKVWQGWTRVDPATLKTDAKFSMQGSGAVPKDAVVYQGFPVVDSRGIGWAAAISAGGLIRLDTKTGEFGWVPVPGLKVRRGRIDTSDRYWVGEYLNDRIGMFDTKTGKAQHWSARQYSSPYTSSVPDKNGRVYSASHNLERVLQLDPKTGRILEFQMPAEFDAKKIAIDRSTKNVTVWMANVRNASLIKVEPQE